MRIKLRDVDVIAPNLHHRYSGVTSTIIGLLPHQSRRCRIASCGSGLPERIPAFSLLSVILGGWRKKRVWHARRNYEMGTGLVLKYIFRQPWKVVFTSAAQRKHAAFTHFMLSLVDEVIATTEIAASYVNRPAILIPHGVDVDTFHPAADKEEAWREKGLPGKYGVGVFGRVREQKGTDLFVAAMIELLPKYPDWTAVITGQEIPKEKEFADLLKKQIEEAGLSERILMLGERPVEEVPGWFRSVTLYVAPMRSEGFGLTPLEAMASGTAVVATRTGAAPQILSDPACGSLVPPDDLGSLVSAIKSYLGDPERAMEAGKRGRSIAKSKHSIENEAEAIVEIYERLLSEN